MIGRTNAGGGGGINFKIVGGTTQPTGKENLIWVNTSTPITNWAVSPNQPENPTEGMVWIEDGDANGINILKKNAVEIFPSRCMQYADGEWKAQESYLYRNGGWVQFSSTYNGELFWNGNQYNEITGGWRTATSGGYSYSIGKTMDMSVISGNGRAGMFYAVNKLDFTGKSGVEVTYITTGTNITIELRTRIAGADLSGTPTSKVTMPMSATEKTVTLPLATSNTMGLYIYFNGGDVGSTVSIRKVRWY